MSATVISNKIDTVNDLIEALKQVPQDLEFSPCGDPDVVIALTDTGVYALENSTYCEQEDWEILDMSWSNVGELIKNLEELPKVAPLSVMGNEDICLAFDKADKSLYLDSMNFLVEEEIIDDPDRDER